MENDVFGKALQDYQHGINSAKITTYLQLPGYTRPIKDTLPVSYLFRGYNEMPELEKKALNHCRGKVLDIGCGAGSHSLFLQQEGLDVTALDVSALAIETCRARGIGKAVHCGFNDYNGIKFDTLLLLMNGIGLAGRLRDLQGFLDHLKTLLYKKGQVLLDSSDIIYMYQDNEDSSFHIPAGPPYYGEGEFVLEYKGQKSRKFPWLYLDYKRLEKAASRRGMKCEFLNSGEHYDYLARLCLE